MTVGHRSDYTGAGASLSDLPVARHMLQDRGYDADWFCNAMDETGNLACIPSRKNRKEPIVHDEDRYKPRHKIEVMFGRLKDWRRIAMRFDRSPTVFLSAIALAALVIYWL